MSVSTEERGGSRSTGCEHRLRKQLLLCFEVFLSAGSSLKGHSLPRVLSAFCSKAHIQRFTRKAICVFAPVELFHLSWHKQDP